MSHPSDTEPVERATAPKIVSTPGTCGGKPRLDGHRIKVQDIAFWHEDLGQSIDEILDEYPTLTRSEVNTALDYYTENREEIRELLKKQREIDEESLQRNVNSILDRYPRRSDEPSPPLSPG